MYPSLINAESFTKFHWISLASVTSFRDLDPGKGAEDLVMDDKLQFKGQEYDGLREMVKAIKKSLGPKRVG